MDDVRLIDANALLMEIDEEIEVCQPETTPSNKFICFGLKKEKKAIKKAPTVDAVPVKRGKWEIKGGVHCTNCGWHPTGKVCDLFTNYCAGCGAKMF